MGLCLFLNDAHLAEPRPLPSCMQVGMDKSISNLVTPLSQLQEEIMVKCQLHAVHLIRGFYSCSPCRE